MSQSVRFLQAIKSVFWLAHTFGDILETVPTCQVQPCLLEGPQQCISCLTSQRLISLGAENSPSSAGRNAKQALLCCPPRLSKHTRHKPKPVKATKTQILEFLFITLVASRRGCFGPLTVRALGLKWPENLERESQPQTFKNLAEEKLCCMPLSSKSAPSPMRRACDARKALRSLNTSLTSVTGHRLH